MAIIAVFGDICDCHQATPRADMDSEIVRNKKQPFFQKIADSMRYDAISFHLSKS